MGFTGMKAGGAPEAQILKIPAVENKAADQIIITAGVQGQPSLVHRQEGHYATTIFCNLLKEYGKSENIVNIFYKLVRRMKEHEAIYIPEKNKDKFYALLPS